MLNDELNISDLYKPTRDQLVLEARLNSKTAAGIHIPEHLREKTWIMKVVAVGSECKEVKVGDLVHAHLTSSTLLLPITERKDVEYLCIKEYDILGIISPDYKLLTTAVTDKKDIN